MTHIREILILKERNSLRSLKAGVIENGRDLLGMLLNLRLFEVQRWKIFILKKNFVGKLVVLRDPALLNHPLKRNKVIKMTNNSKKLRELPSHPIVSAPRRLLQFAVRDAVGTLRPSSSRMEPALKRLRSVVSRATEYPSHNDQYHGMRSSGRLPSAVAIAVKAAAEAAEDASMGRFSGNVFDRLGHTTDASEMTNQSLGFQRNDMEIEEGEEYDQIAGESCNFVPRNEYGTGRQLSEKTPMADENDLTSYDYGSDNDGYDNVNIINHRGVDNSLVNPSRGNKDEDTLMVQYSVANNTDELVKRARVKDQKSPPAAGNRKIVNISVNVNTWKPPAHYQGSEHIREKENLIVNKGKETAKSKPLSLVKENNHMLLPTKESEQTSMIVQKEPSKTASSVTATGSVFTGRPLEDADSRTIFVSNVHFAATKDTLSRHFNKFGDVLKVTIVIDAATGQPKGSAYVEFMRKEAAEHALSLDGTSFMSRILKVVKKSAAYQEASNMVSWPCLARGSPYTGRLVRGTFPRGFPGAFRSRLPIKAGARSLQWKRDAQITPTTENTVNVQLGTAGASSNSSVPSPTARSLTYVRKESKPDGDAGTA
ncbi:hypothetical protein Sjap_013062 [Stephania japonica]|uniref:RRM domain-containing protein n=1 Tax=Stephania japonica TaxID=461633 RepID=A0AAP0NZI4_9MAGN